MDEFEYKESIGTKRIVSAAAYQSKYIPNFKHGSISILGLVGALKTFSRL